MSADAGIQTDTVNDCTSVQPFYFRICIKLIKVLYTKCQIGIGKELNGFSLRKSHEKSVNFFFDCPFLKQTGKCTSGFCFFDCPFLKQTGKCTSGFCQERIGVISMMSTDGAA